MATGSSAEMVPVTRRPLKFQLVLAFAGVALLTAALLAGGMLAMLSEQYARAEAAFLRASADRVLDEAITDSGGAAMRVWAIRAALAAQARVRVFDGAGQLLADSGTPANLDPSMILGPGSEPPESVTLPPRPATATSKTNDEPRSGQVLRVALPSTWAISGGYLLLSEAPAQGPSVLPRVAQTSFVAGVLAVVVAALAGYLLSRRISRPLTELIQATDRMADGDLAVRADVAGSEEVAQLSESFNVMVAQTATTVDALRRFVADAAHELGTPLTALQTDLQLAELAASTDDERRLVQRAFGQSQRLLSLTEGLLSLSRIEGGAPARTERIDLASAVHDAVDAVASRAEQAGLTLEIDLPVGEVPVDADPARLRAVVLNLLDNALKFTIEGGAVRVSVGIERDEAVLVVRDTGIGIPPDELEQVFARFARGRGASGVPGSGIGLAIVRAGVDSMDGTIAVESAEIGTTFTVRLQSTE